MEGKFCRYLVFINYEHSDSHKWQCFGEVIQSLSIVSTHLQSNFYSPLYNDITGHSQYKCQLTVIVPFYDQMKIAVAAASHQRVIEHLLTGEASLQFSLDWLCSCHFFWKKNSEQFPRYLWRFGRPSDRDGQVFDIIFVALKYAYFIVVRTVNIAQDHQWVVGRM